MNWRLSALDGLQLISNSDAHSPAKLGREANLLSIPMSYDGLYGAIQRGEGLEGTIEFFPEEGKYHFDGHRKCHLCISPAEARACGGTTILKPASCLSLAPELLKYVDILVPNQDEITLLCPEGTLEEKADFFLKQGVQTVIITLGADGCYVKTAEWAESFPAEKFQAIDNTGACDAFISALAVYLQKGRSLRQAVRIATFAAGFCITREGVVPSLIDRGSLEAYIDQQAPELLI